MINDIQVVPKYVSVRVSRPCIASVYLVSVSCQCILSVCRVSVSHLCIASAPTFETIHPSFFTPKPSDFDGLETAPSAPSGVNVARNVSRDVSRNVARGVARDVARGVARGVGRMRQYDHLAGAGSPPLFYISHNLSVEMGDFTDKLLTLNHLSVRTCLFTDKPVIWSQPLSGLCASVSKQVDSQEHI